MPEKIPEKLTEKISGKVPNTQKARIKKVKKNNQIVVFEKTMQKSKQWIKDIQSEISFLKPTDAYHLLRAVLHALRDQLNINESAHLTAQLPLLIRGVYYECWNPPQKPHKVASKDEFLNSVLDHLGPAVELHIDLQEGVASVWRVLFRHISEGEMKDVVHSLSPSLREFVIRTQDPEMMN